MCYKVILILSLFVFISGNCLYASPKKILALYKSNENTTSSDNPVLNHLEKYLKDLGYDVDYRDALEELPSSEEMEDYRGIITFYFSPVHPKAGKYISWLSKQLKEGKKVVIFGNFGAHTTDGANWLSPEELNEFFFLFGLDYKTTQKVSLSDIQVIYRDPLVMNSLPEEFPEYFVEFSSINRDNKAYLDLNLKKQADSENVPVVRTPFGGMAQIGYIYSIFPDTGEVIWHLNRPEFLREVLEYEPPEKPSIKTLLALYKGSEYSVGEENLIKLLAVEPLMKLGYEIDYYDIEKGLPEEETMDLYYGIITWYKGPSMYNASGYCEWLADQVASARKVVVMGNFGAYEEKLEAEGKEISRFLGDLDLNNFFYPFGLKMEKQWTGNPELIKPVYLNPDFINTQFLSKPEDFKNYFAFKSVLPDNTSCLTLERTDILDGDSNVIVITPYGGMALEGYIYRQNPQDWSFEFILKLEDFFRDSLKERDFIAPKIYTINVDIEKELARVREDPPIFYVPSPCKEPLPRRLLVIYKGSQIKTLDEYSFYKYGEVILNYLGFICDYIDIEKKRPDEEVMKNYRAIISWFYDSSITGADDYNNWLLSQIDRGIKVIILGEYGAVYEKDNYRFASSALDVFERLGLNCSEQYFYILRNLDILENNFLTARNNELFIVNNPSTLNLEPGRPDLYQSVNYIGKTIEESDEPFWGFESSLQLDEDTDILPLRSDGKNNKNILTLFTSDAGEISPAIIAPWGGILAGDFFYREKVNNITPKDYDRLLSLQFDAPPVIDDNGRWVINPFTFFKEALDLKDEPVLDYTTLNGQRIFYSHIDGDGLVNKSIDNPEKYSGELILEEILKKYNLPVTASIITEEVFEFGTKYYNPPVEIIRRIFDLPNIEVASHTHTHPFDLKKGNLKIDIEDGNYRSFFDKPSPEKEILYSTALINQNLAPPEKVNKIILWPGLCNPGEDFLAITSELGLANLNGGDPLYDREHNSYSNLCSVLLSTGDELQVHTSGSNDYIYTDSWKGNYGGMVNLIDHIEKTESPRRIYPVNVYYHYYSGARRESLEALKKLYDYCMEKHLALLFASQYSLIIKDFYYSQVGKTGDGGYIIKNAGYLRTVRFDNRKIFPDLEKSENILGFDYCNDSLYIFLDENTEHKIYLTSEPQSKVYLKSASHYIDIWRGNDDKVTALIRGIGPGYMEIENLKKSWSYKVIVGDKVQFVKTDNLGLLCFNYELTGSSEAYELIVETE